MLLQQQPEQPQKPPPTFSFRDCVLKLLAICQIWARPNEAWLIVPGTAGKHYFGFQALLGVLWIFFCAGITASGPLMLYGWATAFMLVIQQGKRAQREKQGLWQHTMYSGLPWWLRLRPNTSEATAKGRVMPALMLVIGSAAWPIDLPLGLYLMLSGACMSIASEYAFKREQAEIDAMRNALWYQQYVAQRMMEERQRYGG